MTPSCRLDYLHSPAHHLVGLRVGHKVQVEVGHLLVYGAAQVKVRERIRKNRVCPDLAYPDPWAWRVREAC